MNSTIFKICYTFSMSSQTKRWVIPGPPPPEVSAALSGYPAYMRQILHNRGITNAAEAKIFLDAGEPAQTDPFLMIGMAAAVDRLQTALQKQERIAIYGDYDADGVTATALLVEFFEKLGADVIGYIPNRFEEGYGLNNEALANLQEQGIRVVVSVDCGVRSIEEARYARELGLDLIITDHHHPAEEIPQAFSVINPKQPGDPYPEKNLSGVGIAYKLASAFIFQQEKQGDSIPSHLKAEDLLDLVALGTIADMVPLMGENRYLVRRGMEKIRNTRRQGLHSLMAAAGLRAGMATSGDVSFMLAPRLNAAGRLESALTAFSLLISKNVGEASDLAQKLEAQNRERQDITRSIQVKAQELIKQQTDTAYLLFAVDPEFNPGVVGLVASRLTETYYRPSIVAFQGPEFTRGSCRSIPEFHITEALDACSNLLEHHGGHAAAAGFTVRNENLAELMQRMEDFAKTQLENLALQPTLKADIELPLYDLKPEILTEIERLQPTGQINPPVVFVARGLNVVSSRQVGKDLSHLKLRVSDKRITFDAIAFRHGDKHNQMPPRIDLMFTFEVNEFNGQKTLQLNVRDIQASQ